jgi:hypothetical protein
LGRVPHILINPQKANRVRSAQKMIEALDNHSPTGFKYLLTGAHSWMTYDQGPTQMWTPAGVASMKGFTRLITHRKP